MIFPHMKEIMIFPHMKEIMFGRQPKLPIYILFDLLSYEKTLEYTVLFQKLKNKLKYTYIHVG